MSQADASAIRPRREDAEMPTGLVLLVNATTGVVLVAVAATSSFVRFLGRRAAAVAILPVLTVVLLSAYVFGEDSYRDNGISRWDAYRSPGGALGSMFVLSVALMATCTAVLAYAGLCTKERLFRAVSLAGGLTSLSLLTATIVGFSTN
jgi:hypothetical protein